MTGCSARSCWRPSTSRRMCWQPIRDGNMLFAIDQQQYMQGYLAIVYMTLYLENLNTPGSLLIPTGPGFVTADNAARSSN